MDITNFTWRLKIWVVSSVYVVAGDLKIESSGGKTTCDNYINHLSSKKLWVHALRCHTDVQMTYGRHMDVR